MMRFPSSVATLAAKRLISSSNATPAAFAGAMRMFSAPAVKVRCFCCKRILLAIASGTHFSWMIILGFQLGPTLVR